MGLLHRSCPNPACKRSKKSSVRFYSKKGSFFCKWSNRRVPRYRCRSCKKNFSSSTFRGIYKQKKPYLNNKIFELYVSGVSQRRLAKVLVINRKTVARKFLWLSERARQKHESALLKFGEVKGVQVDEMESFEHTRLKPLSISLAVSSANFKIIDAQVGILNYKGRLANFAFSKYGPRPDTSEEAFLSVLRSVKKAAGETCNLTSDSKTNYPRLIEDVLPGAAHTRVKMKKVPMAQRLFHKGRRNVNDPLFVLNFTAAKIRHDLSRMARKVWVTTKAKNFLQAHLNLYIAYINGYSLS